MHLLGATWQGQGKSGSPKGATWQGHGTHPPAAPTHSLLLNVLLLLFCAGLLIRAAVMTHYSAPDTAPVTAPVTTAVTAPVTAPALDTAPAPAAGTTGSTDIIPGQGSGEVTAAASAASAGGAVTSAGVSSHDLLALLHPVCWRSTEQGGHQPMEGQGGGAGGIPGVAVFGSGCSFCMAGATCSFSVSIMPPARWTTPPGHSQARELNVILSGPALHSGVVEPAAVDDSNFLVTYRIWDAGVYRASIRSSCGTLDYTQDPKQGRPHEMASWELVVHPVPAAAAATANATPVVSAPGGTATVTQPESITGPEGSVTVLDVTPTTNTTSSDSKMLNDSAVALQSSASGDSGSGDGFLLSSPCAAKKYGRWVLHADGKHRWQPYNCTQIQEMDPGQWIKALNDKGIYEINFIGDSHQRMMLLHLRFLLCGGMNPYFRQVHQNFAFVVSSPDGQRHVTLNLAWLGGIYTANNEYGCSKAGRSTIEPAWPQVSPTADIWVVESGYWTGEQCRFPELALASYLSRFLFWVKAQMGRRAKERASLKEAGRRQEPLLIYRPTPPRATEDRGCRSALTNKYVRTANRFERSLIPHFGALLFDSWEIESARFTDNCPHDHHFSCAVRRPNGLWKMVGEVGEGGLYALIHFILNNS